MVWLLAALRIIAVLRLSDPHGQVLQVLTKHPVPRSNQILAYMSQQCQAVMWCGAM